MNHGGDIYRNEVELDFSVNMNPLGIPKSVQNAMHEAVEHCIQYPDPKQEQLKDALAAYEKVSPDSILCGNGASELFLAIVHAIKPMQIVIPVPSFLGYEQAAQAIGAQIRFVPMQKEDGYRLSETFLEELTEETDLLFLANPNNPTGACVELSLLEKILVHCENLGIYVVLDECFLPFCVGAVQYETFLAKRKFAHLIRVRAFTKTFSIPGVRLGYSICENQTLLSQIQRQLPEWNVSIFAQMAGVAAVKETKFIEESKEVIQTERIWLKEQLEKLDCEVFNSETNYLLFKTKAPLYEALLKHKILIRDCSNYQGLEKDYYRIAVKTRQENERLIAVMREEMKVG